MFYRKRKRAVEVYAYDIINNLALIFDPSVAAKNPGNGGGWEKIKLSALIPIQYINPITGSYQSKTEKNYYKSKLHLVSATWQCTDGKLFDHKDLELAIEHEREIECRCDGGVVVENH